jgi:hypothetical protein
VRNNEPLEPWKELLGKDFEGFPQRSFVRRPPATHEESRRGDMIFGVKDFDDLLERAGKRPITLRE